MEREMKSSASREQSNACINSAETQPIFERKLKYSGVKWLGDIPFSWEIIRIGYALCLRSDGKGMSDRKIGLENVESWTGKYIPTESTFEGVGNTFKINDILFGKLRPYLAKVYLAEFEGQAVGDFLVFQVKQNVLPKFVKYYLLNPQIIDVINGFTYGSKMPRASWQDISTLPILIPPLDEQRAIAAFLDSKCAEIDGLLADLDAEVKTLTEYKKSIIAETVTRGLNPNAPMKQSGIPWVGEIPAHWSSIKTKYAIRLVSECKGTTELKVGLENIESWSGKFIPTETEFEGKGIVFNRNDILWGKLRPYLAKVYLADFEGQAVGDFLVFRTLGEVQPRYIKFILLHRQIIDLINSFTYGSKMPRANWQDISQIYIPLPPLSEQIAIADFLDYKCSAIEQSIADKNTQIETLKAYKSSLIYEYVTGKKQVVR